MAAVGIKLQIIDEELKRASEREEIKLTVCDGKCKFYGQFLWNFYNFHKFSIEHKKKFEFPPNPHFPRCFINIQWTANGDGTWSSLKLCQALSFEERGEKSCDKILRKSRRHGNKSTWNLHEKQLVKFL